MKLTVENGIASKLKKQEPFNFSKDAIKAKSFGKVAKNFEQDFYPVKNKTGYSFFYEEKCK